MTNRGDHSDAQAAPGSDPAGLNASDGEPPVHRPLIVAITIGTEGDVTPFCILGRRLLRNGYRFRLIAPETYRKFATEMFRVEFRSLGGRLGDILDKKAVTEIASGGLRAKLEGYWQFRKIAEPLVSRPMLAAWRAAASADLILYHPLAFGAFAAARARSVPAIMVGLQPMIPNGQSPLALVEREDLGRLLNRASYELPRLGMAFLGAPVRQFQKKHRQQRGVGCLSSPLPGRKSGKAVFHAFSPLLVPRPTDWPDDADVGGAITPSLWHGWKPGPNLQRYLDAGDPPIFVGFGSSRWISQQSVEIVLEAVRHWGGRALLARSWVHKAGPRPHPGKQIFLTERLPYHGLFPRLKAVMHHGGLGTTMLGLKAALPTLAAPIFLDQFLWARGIGRLGVGPAPVPLAKLEMKPLAEALARLVEDERYRAAAETWGAVARKEDGAAALIERIRMIVPAENSGASPAS